MARNHAFFIVFGTKINEDFSNIKSIVTKVVPNIGESFLFEKQMHKVKDKLINYSQVEGYTELNQECRGGETIWIFV